MRPLDRNGVPVTMRPVRIVGGVFAVVLSLAAGCSAPEYRAPEIIKPSGPLSLEGAVELAIQNNPDIQSAVQRVAEAQRAIDEASSHYWPALQFVESVTMVDKPSNAFGFLLDQRRFKPGLDFNDPGVVSNWRTGIGASLTLYDGGRRRARLKASVAEARSAVAQAEIVRREIALEVARAFYLIHKARETAATQRKSIETLQTHLRISEARLAEGAARRSDVLAVQVRLAETQEASIIAENSAERGVAGLRLLLGLEISDALELNEPSVEESFPDDTLDDLLARAKRHRMEFLKADEQVRAAEAMVRDAIAGYHPEVSVFGAFGFDDRSPAQFDYGNWSWGVNFIYSLTEVFRTPMRVDQAVARRAAVYAQARKTLLEVELDVKNALLDSEEAAARHNVAAQAVALAEELLRLVEAEYKEGAATITRLLDAELALNQARTRLSATTYDRSFATIATAHAVGEYPEPPQIEEDEESGSQTTPGDGSREG